MKRYEESINPTKPKPSMWKIIMSYMKNYGIFVLIPLVILSVYFLKKIHVVKKHERKK